MGEAPQAFISFTNIRAMGPAPRMSTLSPGLARTLFIPLTAQASGSANAAIWGFTASEMGCATLSDMRTYSANPPCAPIPMGMMFSHALGMFNRQYLQTPQ